MLYFSWYMLSRISSAFLLGKLMYDADETTTTIVALVLVTPILGELAMMFFVSFIAFIWIFVQARRP